MRRTAYIDRNEKLFTKFNSNQNKMQNQKKQSFDLPLSNMQFNQKVNFEPNYLLNKVGAITDRKVNRSSPTARRPMTGKNNYIESNFPETMRYKDSKNFIKRRNEENFDKKIQPMHTSQTKAVLTDKNKNEKATDLITPKNNNNKFDLNFKNKVRSRGTSLKQSENYKQISSSSFVKKELITPVQRYEKVKTPSRGYSNPRDSKDRSIVKMPTNDSHNKLVEILEKNYYNRENKKQSKEKDQVKLKNSFNNNTTNNIDDFFFEYVLRFSYRSKKGYMPNNPGKVNQDSYIIAPNLNKKSWQHYFGICDGHGVYGHLVSAFIKNHLPQIISTTKDFEKNIRQNLYKAFQLTVKKLLTESHIDLSFSGSTVVGCYLLHNKLYCCNVGDSRSIIGAKKQNKWIAKQLSIDHKPSLQKEAERIIKNKGRIQSFKDLEGNPIGPLRVWLKNQNIPGLAMTRSFGDLVAASVGVSWQPQILQFTITEEDRIILIASDGVWQFLSNEQIIEQLVPFYERNRIQQACDFLLELAHTKWTQQCSVIDDISFVLIFMSYNTETN